ncbi:MAG: GDP-L-fucose synthase [Alphaproteobacteria bacterium]|nr:GDP-L-fucose synthase [Alphaproteobacteria bacterium]
MGKQGSQKVWVAGSRGMVGAAITRRLETDGANLLPDPARATLDLRRQQDVEGWMANNKPDVIYLAAARVGGILDNATYPAEFIADNLQIETNIITAAAKLGVSKLVFLGSSCIYPKMAPQPLREEYLLSGPLEETNRAYAVAKLAGLELVRSFRLQHNCDFISVLPCNLYGPNDTYDAKHSHVIPALLLKFRAAIEEGASEITLWGTGTPRREFLHVDDCADAIVHLANTYSSDSPVNIGTGEDMTIAELADMLCAVTGFKGRIVYDTSKPDGTPRKVLDVTRLQASSWKPKIPLQQGLAQVWQAFCLQPWPLPSPEVSPRPYRRRA